MSIAMTIEEAYSYLFTDALIGAMLVPVHESFVYKVMLMFGGFSPWVLIVISAVGGTIGSTINWVLGKIFRTVDKTGWIERQGMHSKVPLGLISRCRFLLLLLSGLPILGAVVTFTAGLFRVRLREVLLFAFLGQATYYVYVISFF